MGLFKNPWGKGSGVFDNWFSNRWDADNKSEELSQEMEQNDPGSNVSDTKKALICWGRGASLGDFSVFAKALKSNHLTKKYKADNIYVIKTYSRIALIDAIEKYGGEDLAELHIFSHSTGAGLFLSYGDIDVGRNRATFINNTPVLDYDKIVVFETGPLFTDHLVVTLQPKKTEIQNKLINLEFTKFWGCNTGKKNHVWWDDENEPKYWAYLNDKNTPKPSIAQCFADFTNQPVYGASSGSHIEFEINGEWKKYANPRNVPKDYTDIRLHPDVSDYKIYEPV